MAMRNYGVQSKCMLLNEEDFRELIERVDEINGIETKDIDFNDLLNLSYTIDFCSWFTDFTGVFTYIGTDKVEYIESDDTIFIFELEKDTLFDKYNDHEEIYNELKERFNKIGIELSINYIESHFGYLEGSYWG